MTIYSDPTSLTVTTGQTGTSQARGVERAGAAGTDAAREARGGRTDEVALSGLAASLQSLQPDSAERQQRVESLREAVAAGRYEVDAAAVASSIVQEAGA